ncbi:MAG: M14 family zinc carboxypeptidase [Pseudomonadota bacterium]
MKSFVLIICLVATLGAQAAGGLQLADLLDEAPGVEASIPTPESVVGIRAGERHWYHHEIIRYLDALAAVSPRMVALGEHARSYGGRELVTYAISSPANIARLDEIRAARQKIVDPATIVALDDQPAVLHMMYSIHGNEPSGTNATPLVAYYLNAVTDPKLLDQLDKLVIIFNPMQNPDGLDRFANWTNSHRGLVPSSDQNDREHREAFPGARTNYYWFDLNRDWLPHQHPESRGRLGVFHEWKPNVQLDFHEQGSDNNFFFMPGEPKRTHPLTPAINQTLTNRIADFHRRAFDSDGTLYFSEEGYDDFFMGKGSTYADLFGCVGILFEQPSARGARQETVNGLLTFETSIRNQFTASLSSIEATAALRNELLAYQRDFYVDNATQNRSRRGFYLATAEGDPTRLAEFVRVLQGHEIEVRAVTSDITVDGVGYPAGASIAVPASQREATFLRALWDRQVEFEENVFYDVSTWTMPWAFNLSHTREPVRGVDTAVLEPGALIPSARRLAPSAVGYVIDWRDSSSAALLYGLLAAEANVRVAKSPMTVSLADGSERKFGYGTLLVAKALNESIPDEALRLLRAASESGAAIYPVASSSTGAGIDLGSREFEVLKLPKVLLATGPEASAYSAGEIWHLLDQRVQMPITMADTNRFAGIDLSDYTHVLLTSPIRSLSATGFENLTRFVKDGGILWAQGDATIKWLADKKLTSVVWRKTAAEKRTEQRKKSVDGGKTDDAGETYLPERLPFASARDEAAFRLVRGAILEARLDITHPVGYGYTSEFLPVFRRGERFMDRSENPYSTPILYADKVLLSGYVSEENQRLAAGSAGLIVDQQGKGAVVQVLDSLTFRAFWWGTQKLLLNTIFFGDLLEEPK